MNVHYVQGDNIKVAYFPETKRFFCVNQKACELIDAMIAGETKDNLLQYFGIDENLYQKYYNNIFSGRAKESNEINSYSQEVSTIHGLSRLVIHLTNDCNMRCQYCYANGGNYLSDRDMMDKQTLDKLLEVFFKEFDTINNIQFFGGEPLMNYPLLEYACKKINQLAEDRGYTIGFGIVTNGTLIDKKFIDLVKKYKIQVTISYDGNPKVNDIMRRMKNGKGSSDIILEKAKWLKEETGEPNTIEATYNQHHIDNSISIMDVVNHIQKELPDTYIHLVPAGGTDETDFAIENLEIFPDSIHEIVARKKDDNQFFVYSLAHRIFIALENREINIPNICDAGFGTMSVSTKGQVYPCFMFTDNDELCYGNITNKELFKSPKFIEIKNKINNFSVKSNNEECQNCFIKSLCNGCLGLNSFHSGNPFKLSSKICNMFRHMTEQALLEYAEIYNGLKETER